MKCEFCSVEFSRKKTGPSPRFCSSLCQNRQWQKDHPERILELWRSAYGRHREKKLEYVKRYQMENRDVNRRALKKFSLTEHGRIENRAKAKRYRARKLGATGSHTRQEFLTLVARFSNFCPACGKRFATEDFTEDHVVPLSCGGSNSIDNIQPLCHPCNSRKRNRTVDYRAEEYGYHLDVPEQSVPASVSEGVKHVLPLGSSVRSGNVTDITKGDSKWD